MATVAQGQQAGALAAEILSLQAFVAQMQGAAAAGASLNSISITFAPPNGAAFAVISGSLTPQETLTLLDDLISLAQSLITSLTAQLSVL
jgi:hypothetical protein